MTQQITTKKLSDLIPSDWMAFFGECFNQSSEYEFGSEIVNPLAQAGPLAEFLDESVESSPIGYDMDPDEFNSLISILKSCSEKGILIDIGQ